MKRVFVCFVVLAVSGGVALASEDLPDPDSLEWMAVAGAAGYHVYRGTLPGGLPGNYGDCLVGSVPGLTAPIPDNPPLGVVYTYLVSSFDENSESDLGMSSAGTTRFPTTPCVPARRVFGLTPNGDPGDGVEDGVEPRRNPSAWGYAEGPGGAPRGKGEHVMRPHFGAGVRLHTGEFYAQTREHILLGRQVSFAMIRTYRSQIAFDGPLGHGWDMNLNARLVPEGVDVRFHDGTGRSELFTDDGTGTSYVSPRGVYAVLHATPGGKFQIREHNGDVSTYHELDGSNLQGVLERVEARGTQGGHMTILHDYQGLLTQVVDSLGRVIDFGYDSTGHLTSMTDFAGRTWSYSYDAAGNLVSATSPKITGTPGGNDFPLGKTTSYSYSSGFADDRLNHNLLTIVAPSEQTSGVPRLQNTYETTGGSFSFDRVISQIVGGTNASGIPAGGTLVYNYTSLNPSADPLDLTIPRRLTEVVDPNGNEREFLHNHPGHPISVTERTNRNIRPGEPDYTETFTYNSEGEILEQVHPEGNRTQYVYDQPGLDRYREGNVLEVRHVADSLSGGGRGDGHGTGELNDSVIQATYEPVFNQLRTRVEPRGTDPTYIPQNGGSPSPARYTTTFTYDYMEGDPALNGINALATQYDIDLTGAPSFLGDRNSDARTDQASGNLVRVDAPTVTLDPSSNQFGIQGDTTQEIATQYRWSDLDMLRTMVDAEENVHEYTYYPETDPDGNGTPTPTPPDGRVLNPTDGGYLASSRTDTTMGSGRNNGANPIPADLLHTFGYDEVGNLTHHVDGRGVLTRYVHNQLDQIMEIRRGAATGTVSGPPPGLDPATGRGEPGLPALGYEVRFQYDANDNLTHRFLEDVNGDRGSGTEVEACIIWDIQDSDVGRGAEAGTGVLLFTDFRYDANGNLTRVIHPEGNENQVTYDERDLVHKRIRGAAGPRGGTPATRSFDYDANGNLEIQTNARGQVLDVVRDGFDRPTRITDEIGNTTDRFYDPAGLLIQSVARGPIGGPSPISRSGAGNVDLAESEFLYDEMGRPFESKRMLFIPSGIVPLRTPVTLAEGSLDPTDGAINRITEFDRLSRPTFDISDTSAQERYDYDGAGRLVAQTFPDGSLRERFYDANSNLIEEVLTEHSSTSGVPSELFLSTYFHDALNRMTMAVDNLGQTHRLDYDSLDAVRAESDPNGLVAATIFRRSPPHSGTLVSINLHGNVTRYGRDGVGRLTAMERVLTLSGLGDGTLNPPPDTGNPHNPDGLLRSTYSYDDNSLLTSRFDDNGHQTSHTYDNLNRPVTRMADDGTAISWTYDPEDNVTIYTDANGSVISRIYDNADRVTQLSIVRAAGVEGTTQQTFEHDGLYRMTSSTDNNEPSSPLDDAHVVSLYESTGRLFEEQQIHPATGAQVVSYGWEGHDLVTDVFYPSGRHLKHVHDAADRLVAVTDTVRSETATYAYLGMERIHTRTYGNGVRSTVLNDAGTLDEGFDGVQRLQRLRHLTPTSTLLSGFDYTYDGASNRTSQLRLHHTDLGSGGTRGELYSVDSGDRLIDFQEAFLNTSLTPVTPLADSQSWLMDGEGNWEEMSRTGTGYLFTPNNLNEYDENQSGGTRFDDGIPDDVFDVDNIVIPVADGLNHAHDKSGHLTDSGRHEYVYDVFGRLVEVRDPAAIPATVANYQYDAENRRVHRSRPGSGDEQHYLYHSKKAVTPRKRPGRLKWSDVTLKRGVVGLVEVHDTLSGGVEREVVFGAGEPVWQIQTASGDSQYLHEDGQGSIVMLTEGVGPVGGGGPGTVLERVTYDAYGKPTFESASNTPLLEVTGEPIAESTYGNPYLFSGMLYDPETSVRSPLATDDAGGLYHVPGAGLNYNPDEGRYLTREIVSDPGSGIVAPGFHSTDGGGGSGGRLIIQSPDQDMGSSLPLGDLGRPGGGQYGSGGAPTNLGVEVHTAGKKSAKQKAREIVVVGSKVKEVIREAGLRSDGGLVQAGTGATAARSSKPREIVVVGSKVKDVVRSAGLRSDGELVQAVSDKVHEILEPALGGAVPTRIPAAIAIPNLLEARIGANESKAAGSTLELTVAGRGGVPMDASAIPSFGLTGSVPIPRSRNKLYVGNLPSATTSKKLFVGNLPWNTSTGAHAEVEYVPYLGDVILEIPAAAPRSSNGTYYFDEFVSTRDTVR